MYTESHLRLSDVHENHVVRTTVCTKRHFNRKDHLRTQNVKFVQSEFSCVYKHLVVYSRDEH